MVSLKSNREIALMRESAKILKDVFIKIKDSVKAGVSTKEIDLKVEKLIRAYNAEPAFLGYYGFPASVCASVNEEVVHGIPSPSKILKEGDIISLDIGVKYKGYYSDAARTWAVGKIPKETQNLIDVTRQSLFEGVKALNIKSKLGDVSSAVQKYIEDNHYSVVRDFVGHGFGRELHEDPQVPNYGEKGRGLVIEEGLVVAIEPMVNVGTYKVRILADGWTVVTTDGSLSAHHEETIAVTQNGPEVLTQFERS